MRKGNWQVAWIFVCAEHKTSKHYGELAKWIAPGKIHAMTSYMGLPGMDSALFLQLVMHGTAHCSAHWRFAFVGELDCPANIPPKCNLIRKFVHTKLMQMSKESQVLDLFAKADAHFKKVAQDVYTIGNFADDATLG